MADLNSNRSSSPLLESDDISILVHTLLQRSTLPSSVSVGASQLPDHQQCPPAPKFRRQFCGSAAFSDSPSALKFSYAPDESERSRGAFSSAMLSSAEDIGEFDCEFEDQDASEVPWKSGPPRSSSKRARETEIHNLTEKRRRQRINEKMKALQKLIPNSNKTDKASMLDEAIEYLKQLQLQVQMLALRNGSTLHSFYMPRMHSAQPSDPGICFNGVDGLPSSSRGASSQKISREFSCP